MVQSGDWRVNRNRNIIGNRKILFLSHYFPPETNAPASRVHEMAKVWAQDGHDVTVITSVPNCPTGVVYAGYKNKIVQAENVDGIRVIRVWTYIAANKGCAKRIMNYATYMLSAVLVGLFVKKPDVLIATSPQFMCGWAGVFLKFLRRIPFILEIRDLWPDSIVAVGAIKSPRVLRFLGVFEIWMYWAATHIVTVGPGYREQLLRKGIRPDKVTVVSNGVDTQLFSPRSQDLALRRRHGIDSVFVCAYVGTMGMASGLNVVIDVAQLLRDRGLHRIKFMLIGEGAIREDLQQRANELGLDNIVFTGQLARELIPRYLASVDSCLIHLRRTELFKSVLPTKIFEAAAMQRPIILGVEGHAAELVTAANAGICIEPENAAQLASAIIKLANDKELARNYGFSGCEYIRTNFDRRMLARTYLQQIHFVLAKHSVKYAQEAVANAGQVIREKKLTATDNTEASEPG